MHDDVYNIIIKDKHINTLKAELQEIDEKIMELYEQRTTTILNIADQIKKIDEVYNNETK